MKLKKLNPETNRITRAVLYVIGVGGFLHLSTLLILAITKKEVAYFNPLFAIDFDKVWPSVAKHPLVFIGGWVIFFTAIYLLSRSLNRR